MARRYTVNMESVSVTMGTATDLFQVLGATGKMLRIISYKFKPTDVSLALPTAAMIRLRSRYFPATVTQSGGTSITPSKVDPGDAAAAFTAFINNTTLLTTNGTAVVTDGDGGHIYAGVDVMLPAPPFVGPSTAWAVQLLAGAVQTVVCSGSVLVEEAG